MTPIQAGSLVVWNPQDLDRIFSENFALKLSDQLPLPGIVKRIDGKIALMSYMQQTGQVASLPVKLSELCQAGVCHAAE